MRFWVLYFNKNIFKVFAVPKEHPNIPLTVHPTPLCQLSARYLPVEYKKHLYIRYCVKIHFRLRTDTIIISFSIFKHYFGGFQGLQLGPWFICLLALPQNKLINNNKKKLLFSLCLTHVTLYSNKRSHQNFLIFKNWNFSNAISIPQQKLLAKQI